MLLKGFRFGMLLQLAVGPICIYILKTGSSLGLLSAMIGVLAVVIIDGIFILGAILGMGTLIDKYNNTKLVLKYFGAIVLVIFGFSNILDVLGIDLLPSLNFLSRQNIKGVFVKTFVLTLSNPLTILFWAGVFSTKIVEENMEQKDMYYFGLGAILSTLAFLTLISIFGSFINIFLKPQFLNILNIIVGLILIGFGVKTATKKL
ncbi:LysE family transporter [Clostridiisalibacter paucivorans]|uniref:LysE family transporter n=1 Tax=Clostridiisalibacter paucivorans TaxID=408753 RepID=UPI00047D23AB